MSILCHEKQKCSYNFYNICNKKTKLFSFNCMHNLQKLMNVISIILFLMTLVGAFTI